MSDTPKLLPLIIAYADAVGTHERTGAPVHSGMREEAFEKVTASLNTLQGQLDSAQTELLAAQRKVVELEADAVRIDKLAAIYSRSSKGNAEGLHTYAVQFDAPGGLNFRTAVDLKKDED